MNPNSITNSFSNGILNHRSIEEFSMQFTVQTANCRENENVNYVHITGITQF